ncbi:DUF2058 domain-containing protein [Pseudoxanthomonas wuyuanensis]
MSDTLRDQLLGLGFKPAPSASQPPKTGQAERKPGRKPERKQGTPPRDGQGRGAANKGGQSARSAAHKNAGGKPPRSSGEIDLAKAYAIRAQREKDERIEAERRKQEEARLRREAKARLESLLKDKALNDPDAEIARHFPYGGKIKRIYVNQTQLKALNAGKLGVVQQNGRYLLVTAELLAQAEAVFAPSVALKVDPAAPAADDPYADPQYQVPDDLVW